MVFIRFKTHIDYFNEKWEIAFKLFDCEVNYLRSTIMESELIILSTQQAYFAQNKNKFFIMGKKEQKTENKWGQKDNYGYFWISI